jgi:hypothetical protein
MLNKPSKTPQLRLLIRVKLSTGADFSGIFLGRLTADAERSSPTYHTSIDAVWAKDVSVGMSHLISKPLEELPHSKKHLYGDGNNTGFQLKPLHAYLDA